MQLNNFFPNKYLIYDKIDSQEEDFRIICFLIKNLKKIKSISNELNSPSYLGYKNYKLINLKLFFFLIFKGFYSFLETTSEISYRNIRYFRVKSDFYTSRQ